MAHIRFVTCESLEGYFFDPKQPALTIDDMILHDELVARGHTVTPLVWSSDEAQNPEGDMLIVRSPWDYFEKTEAFKAWMLHMADIGAPLYNSANEIIWNLRKNYLADLEACGVPIIPTLFLNKDEQLGNDFFKEMGEAELVFKPQEGANAFLTERLGDKPSKSVLKRLNKALKERDYMIQPFLSQIQDEGEWSLVYFNGAYSHGFLKKAKEGDFRVQEEHGGSLHTPPVPTEIISSADTVMDALDHAPLYARVDGVMVNGEFLLMELEMFEPELYFRADKKAASNMADAIEALLL